MGKGFFKGLFTGALAGATFGVVAGLLSAPKSGKDLREDLRKHFDTLSADVQKKAQELEVVSKDAYEKVVNEAMDTFEKVKKMDQKDIMALRDALMKEWDKLSQSMMKQVKKAAK